eukprot:3298251-Pleurochrysis_carterae.AAC.1
MCVRAAQARACRWWWRCCRSLSASPSPARASSAPPRLPSQARSLKAAPRAFAQGRTTRARRRAGELRTETQARTTPCLPASLLPIRLTIIPSSSNPAHESFPSRHLPLCLPTRHELRSHMLTPPQLLSPNFNQLSRNTAVFLLDDGPFSSAHPLFVATPFSLMLLVYCI